MAISASTTFDVAEQDALSLTTTLIVQPAVGLGTGGNGRLTHPVIGVFDYVHAPTHTVNIDGDVIFGPLSSNALTLSGSSTTQWPGYLGDRIIKERWLNGETGGLLTQLRALQQMFANVPSDPDSPIIWSPNYATALSYKVVILGVTSGGEEYAIDWRLAEKGYAPQPVELQMRVLDYAD